MYRQHQDFNIYYTQPHYYFFFKMPSLISMDHFQSSTEILRGEVTIPSDTSWNAEIIADLRSLIFL